MAIMLWRIFFIEQLGRLPERPRRRQKQIITFSPDILGLSEPAAVITHARWSRVNHAILSEAATSLATSTRQARGSLIQLPLRSEHIGRQSSPALLLRTHPGRYHLTPSRYAYGIPSSGCRVARYLARERSPILPHREGNHLGLPLPLKVSRPRRSP